MLHRALRPAARALRRTSPTASRAAVQRRWESHDSHGSHDAHGPNPAFDAEAREESFFTPLWRNVAIVTVLGYAAYAFWPQPKEGETPYLTRALSSGQTTEQSLEHIEQRIAFVQKQAEHKKESDDAPRPPIHRFRYKHAFDQASPYLIPVGTQADLSDVKIKTREDAFHK